MDIRKLLATLVALLPVIVLRTATKLDDIALDFLKALEASPFMIDWLQTLFTKQEGMPESALNHIDPNTPELVQAFEQSPLLRDWARKNRPAPPPGTPEEAQPLITELAALLKYLPMLLELWRAWKKLNPTT